MVQTAANGTGVSLLNVHHDHQKSERAPKALRKQETLKDRLERLAQKGDVDPTPQLGTAPVSQNLLYVVGTASIASPFTYKGDSIRCITPILRLGSATLATVMMMYKTMAINSLITAFSLSVLVLDGVKLGDA